MVCARNENLLEEAKFKIRSCMTPEQKLLVLPLDVTRRASVDAAVKTTVETFGKIDILVNNAGVYGPKGLLEEIDWDDWVRSVETNLHGSVYVCRTILPYFKKENYGKVIQLSGGGATSPMPRLSAYAVSKAAIVRFSESLAGEVREFNIDVNCIAPGAINTKMLDEILEAGPEKVGNAYYQKALAQKENGGTPPERGADLAVYLGSAASDGITGRLISAVWDPWQDLASHKDDLARSDVYTLRRIVPEDRGMKWGNPG